MIRIGSEGPIMGKDYVFVLGHHGTRISPSEENYLAKFKGVEVESNRNFYRFQFFKRLVSSFSYEDWEVKSKFVEALNPDVSKNLRLKILLTQLLKCISAEELYELIYESGI